MKKSPDPFPNASPTKSRAIRIAAHGGPEQLRPVELDVGDPGPGEARIRLEASGVNFIDTYHRTGLYPTPLPFVPGVEGAGVVEAVGPDTAGVAVGDRVAWTLAPGTYAERCRVPVERLVRVPDGLSIELAAATLLQGTTAHYLTHGVRDTRPGDTTLVHAAAGGTGALLVQMLARAGARILATCSTEEKAERARAAGAHEVIRYTEEDFPSRVRTLTDGRGVDVVYDSVGRSTFDGSLASLRPRGLLCSFGQSSGPVPPFDLARLNDAGSIFLTRPSLAHYLADRESLEARAGAVFAALESGELEQRIDGRYPLEEAERAHRDLESRRTSGKLLLLPTLPR